MLLVRWKSLFKDKGYCVQLAIRQSNVIVFYHYSDMKNIILASQSNCRLFLSASDINKYVNIYMQVY